MRALLLGVVLVIACKGKGAAPAAGSASAGSGSAPVAVADAAVAVADAAPPPAKLEFEEPPDTALKLAFGKSPVLPAVSADGTLVADYHSYGGPGMAEQPQNIGIRPLGGGKTEELPIVEDKDVENVEEEWANKPPPEALQKTLKARGDKIVKRLEGFASLVPVSIPRDDNDLELKLPAKIGELTFKAVIGEMDNVVVTLTNASGRVVRSANVPGYGEGGGEMACSFSPTLPRAVYTDQAKTKLYVPIDYRFRDDCGDPYETYVVWDLPTPEEDELAALVAAQFDAGVDMEKVFTADAQLVNGSDVATETLPYIIKAGNEQYAGHDTSNLVITKSADGKSAWASSTEKLAILPQNQKGRDEVWRASSLLVKTPAGWRIAATTWTQPVKNDVANRDAKAGKLKPGPAFTVDPGDASLRAAFEKLVTAGLTSPRADLIAFGSGPGERTTTGAALAKGWNAGWKGKATITSSIARLLPSGTTGWVAANVELAKGSYKIPFQIFAVFDKASSGEWTLVHMHFSV